MDAFHKRLIHQLGSGQTPDVLELKAEVDEIWKLVDELYDRPFILAPIITEIKLEIEFENI